MNRKELIEAVGEALNDEWPHMLNDGVQKEVAALAIEVYEELSGELV